MQQLEKEILVKMCPLNRLAVLSTECKAKTKKTHLSFDQSSRRHDKKINYIL